MILISLSVENFRQFHGKQSIEFARGADGRNVTLIHGFNGAGKTTLLNAFVWCLYGKTTADFGAPDRLVNERASSETPMGKQLRVSVMLRYMSRGDEYVVERSQTSTKSGSNELHPGEPELAMWQVISGQLIPPAGDQFQRQQRIDQMLPSGLYPFVFFNGERMEWLAKSEASKDVERGIKIFLDVEIYERSLRHLRGDVARELAEELKSLGSAELKEALNQEGELKKSEEEAQQQLAGLDRNLAALRDEIDLLEARQSSIQVLHELAQRRDLLRTDLQRCERTLKDADMDLAHVLSDDGYLTFGDPIFVIIDELINAARERGELPAKIKPQFVGDLLDRQECICGRRLDPEKDAAEVNRLTSWRDQVGLAVLEEAVSQTAAAIPTLRKRREKLFEDLDRIQGRRALLFAERAQFQNDLASVDDQMGERTLGEDVDDLKRHLDSCRRQQVSTLASQKHEQEKLEAIRERLSSISHRIKSLKVQDARAALVKSQKEAVEHIADVLEEIFEVQKQDVRDYLSSKVGQIWSDAAIKPYKASLLEDFTLSLTKFVNGVEQPVHGASTGEKQVLALSFVGSLVQKARENLETNKGSGNALGIPVGGEYPLVMDSPFGSLEDDYRAKVAHWIPTLANQVVIMVSKTQWRDEVERETRPRVGKEYVLELHTQKQGADRAIIIEGTEYNYVVETRDPAEHTIIREVI